MPLLIGGAVLVVFALLSLSASEGREGKKRSENTLLGALAVAAVVFMLAKAGLAWVGVGLALLWSAAQRFGGERRTTTRTTGEPASARGSVTEGRGPALSKEEAREVLGVSASATPDEILAAYRRLMKKVHPDLGGTTYLATRLNQAKDVLLG